MDGDARVDDRTISIPGWEKFQHYKKRRPPWIKLHTDLLHRDEYLDLSGFDRAVLHGLWLMAAENAHDTPTIAVRHVSSTLAMRANSVHAAIERLNHAGFIHVSASKALARRKQSAIPETETETEATVATAPVAPKVAKRNLEFDLLGEIFGYLPNGQEARLWGKLSADLRKQRPHVDLELLNEAARRYKLDMPGVTITAPALVKHYPRLMASAWHAPNGNGHGKGLTFDQLKQAALRQPAGRTPDERPASRPALGSGEGRLSFDADPA